MPLNGNSNAFAQIEQMQSLADGFVDDPVLRAKAQEGLVQYLRQQPLLQSRSIGTPRRPHEDCLALQIHRIA